MVYKEPVIVIHHDHVIDIVIKSVHALRIPTHVPLFPRPFPRSSSAAVTLDEFVGPQYLDDDLFHLAWLPVQPVVDVRSYQVVQHLNYSSKEELPVHSLSSEGSLPQQWVLSKSACVWWRAVEMHLHMAIFALESLITRVTADDSTPYTKPVHLSAFQHGFSRYHEDEQSMRNAAWLSRHVIFANMAHLAFVLSVCRFRNIPRWRETLQRVTDKEFATWARTSSTISSYDFGYRRGGFVDAREPLRKQAWQGYIWIFVVSGVPLWINYGAKKDSFEAQVQGTRVDWLVALSPRDFTAMQASVGFANLVAWGTYCEVPYESSLRGVFRTRRQAILTTVRTSTAHERTEMDGPCMWGALQAEVPSKFPLWVNPSVLQDTLYFHYGLDVTDSLESPAPLRDAVQALGWRHVAVPVAVADVAQQLNINPRPVEPEDLRRADSDFSARVTRAWYVPYTPIPPQPRSGRCFVILNLIDDGYQWLLVVYSEVVVLHILRRFAHLPTARIVRGLSLQGIPYSLHLHDSWILYRDIRSGNFCPPPPSLICTDLIPGVRAFLQYMDCLKDFFQQRYRLRAAIQQGGIVWRIASYMLIQHHDLLGIADSYLDGPADTAHLYGGSPRYLIVEGSEKVTCWEDVLSHAELAFICGTYPNNVTCV